MKRIRFTEEQITGVLREHEAGAKANGNVGGFVRKWRAGQNKTANSYVIEIAK